jgi:hypothetical protein
MTDGELVAAFATDGAEAAFAEFVRRHAAMVFRNCRRITGSHQDAKTRRRRCSRPSSSGHTTCKSANRSAAGSTARRGTFPGDIDDRT